MLKLLPAQSVTPIAMRSPSLPPWPPKVERFRRGDTLPDRGDQIWQLTTHEGKLLAIRLTHQQLADLAGTTRI